MNEQERVKYLALQCYLLKIKALTEDLLSKHFPIEEIKGDAEDGGHETKSL